MPVYFHCVDLIEAEIYKLNDITIGLDLDQYQNQWSSQGK